MQSLPAPFPGRAPLTRNGAVSRPGPSRGPALCRLPTAAPRAPRRLHRAAAGAAPGVPGEPAPGSGAPGSDEPAPSSDGGRADKLLGLPLLLSSSLSHVNRHYIRLRRRQKWWSKLGGYPKVPSEGVDHLPEPAVELWQKVVPLGLIFFAASFNLTVLQSLKDAIVVTASGAETLPFLMSLCVLPASVAFFVMYGNMVSALPERAVFYAAVAPLLAFYALFATVVYPAAPALHLDPAPLLAMVPPGLAGLVKVVANWSYSLFFCFAELWGGVVISVLFWSLANETVTVEEAKSVYPLMAVGANVALVAGGCFIRAVNAALPPGSQLLGLRVLVGSVVAMSCAMFAAKAFLDARILGPLQRREAAAAAAAAAADAAAAGGAPPSGAPSPEPAGGGGGKKGGGKKKEKGSFSENFAVLKSSAKIRNLALLVMGYGVAHRLFEFAWKAQLRVTHPTVQGYQGVLADVSTYTGMLTLVSMVVSRLIFQHLGWGVAACVTPAVMGAAGAVFFGSTLLGMGAGGGLLPEGGAAAMVALGAVAGVVTQVFARAAKYSLFDPAKEMVFIEMDKEEKRRGKAAVDLVGSQIGKSGASWITQAFLLLCGSMAAATPFVAVVFLAVVVTWIQATLGLHRQMQETEAARAAALAAERPPPAGGAGAGAASPGAGAGAPAAPALADALHSAGGGSGGNGHGHGHGEHAAAPTHEADGSGGAAAGAQPAPAWAGQRAS